MENSSNITTYDKLDGFARWFGTSVATAFFNSLERCSCVNLSTYDTDDEDDEEAKDRPLMFNLRSSSTASSASAATTSPAAATNPTSVNNLPV